MTVALIVSVDAHKSCFSQCVDHECRVFKSTHLIGGIGDHFGFAELDHEHAIRRQSIEEGVDKGGIIVQATGNFDGGIGIQRIHDDNIKLILLPRPIVLVLLVITEPIHKPAKRILVHRPRPLIVKTRFRMCPLIAIVGIVGTARRDSSRSTTLQIRAIRPFRHVLPAYLREFPIDLEHDRLRDRFVLEDLAKRRALPPSYDGNLFGMGVREHGGMDDALVVGCIAVQRGLDDVVEEEHFIGSERLGVGCLVG
mmetsp:Transcript_31667/g.66341  ORF Transcript_31667/g.66341 Transcript_31667/m.66341 type:complete len:253 (+) Transcript_31667:3788-4546(+)